MKGATPLGIKLVCSVYIVNTVLFVLSLFMFYSRIFILGNEIGPALSSLVRFVLVFIPMYLYFRLAQLKKDAFFLAIIFHLFFLINAVTNYLEYLGCSYSIIHITGLYGSDIFSSTQMLVLCASAVVNLCILGYLYNKRNIFGNY